MLLVLLAACATAPEPVASAPAAWEFDGEPTEPVPLVDADLDLAFQDVVDTLSGIDPLIAHGGHRWAMGHSDASCPVMDEHNGQDLWWGDCETASGTRFDGFSLYTHESYFPRGEDIVDHYIWAHSHMVVDPVEGGRFVALGDNEVTGVRTRDGRHEQQVYLLGNYDWSDEAAPDSWIQNDLSVWLYMLAAEMDEGVRFTVDGGINHAPGLFSSIEIEHFSIGNGPQDCELEPETSMRVWEPGGGWYDVRFDGADADGVRTDGCDGCGVLSWNGEDLGPVCADFSAFHQWSGVWKW